MSFDLSEQSYEIKDELKIRGILEKRTDWSYEFTKNSKYEYDLQLFRWRDPPEGPSDREHVGYVEIERANAESDWQSGDIPDYWPEIRFCRRKIDQGRPPIWGGPKQNSDRTVYLKFNYEVDNCFAAPIPDIRDRGEETYWPPGKQTRNSAFYALDPNTDVIAHGIDDCIKLISEHLSFNKKLQQFRGANA